MSKTNLSQTNKKIINPQNKEKKMSKTNLSQTKNNQNLNQMKIFHINCRGTIGKIEELFQFIEENDPDFLCMTETKLDESISDCSCEPPGYKIIRKDRSEQFKSKYNMTGLGGGVAILYKKGLKVEIFTKNKEETEEILWVYAKGKKSFLIGVVYNTNYCKLMCEKMENLFLKNM